MTLLGGSLLGSRFSQNDIDNAVDSSLSAPSSAGRLIGKLSLDLSDATILVGSDSTGNESFEWVYLYSQWLASKYPSYTVEYYLWDVVNKEFPSSPEVLQVGTGTNTLSIYNGAVGGSRPDYMLGERFSSFAIGKNADLIICNYGHNIAEDSQSDSYKSSLYCKFLEFIVSVSEVNQDAGCIVVGQNPQRTNDKMKLVVENASLVASMMECDYADAYTKFIKSGRPETMYLPSDVVHPSEEGQQVYLDAIKALSISVSPRCVKHPTFEVKNNLIPENTFSNWSGTGLPSGFTRSGNALLSQDITNLDIENFSLKIESSSAGAGNTFIQHTLDDKSLRIARGKTVISVMRFFRPAVSTPPTSGKVEIFINNSVRVETAEHTNLPLGRFHYRAIIAKIPVDATSVKLNYYADDGTTDAEISISAVGCFVGSLFGDIS